LIQHMGPDVPPTVHSLMDLSRRYVWVASEAAWWDRLIQGVVRPSGLNGSYSSLGTSWRGQDASGGPLPEEEQGPPVTVSEMLQQFPATATADALDFWPGVKAPLIWEDGQVLVNMWRRPTVEGRPGDVRPWLRLIEALIQVPEERWYVIQWMAHCLRRQDLKINHNLLIGGAPRIGKDSIFQPLIRGLGEGHNVCQIQSDKLAEPYEDFFVGRKLVVIQEVLHAGVSHKRIENKLKPFGAAPPNRLELRRHGRPSISQRNVGQILAMTNYRDAIALDTGAARWYAVWCEPETPPWSVEEYQRYYQWLDSGGAEAVLYFLEHQVSLQGFQPGGQAPATPWRDGLVMLAGESDSLETEIKDRIHQRVYPFHVDVVRAQDVCDSVTLAFTADRETRVSRRTVAAILQRLGCRSSGETAVWSPERKNMWRPRFWVVRDQLQWGARSFELWQKEYDRGRVDPAAGPGGPL